MNMSPSAIAPRQSPISETDRAHPLFGEYNCYRSSMSILLVEAASFSDWLFQRERQKADDIAAQHPRFPEFQAWMRDTRAGGRRCPGGVSFPANFKYWLTGGRW